MNPKELVTKWVEVFNQADAKAIADFYHPHAINHQVANEPIEGKEAIYEMFKNESHLLITLIYKLFNNILDSKTFAIEWHANLQVPIHEIRNKDDCNNYRSINTMGEFWVLLISDIGLQKAMKKTGHIH